MISRMTAIPFGKENYCTRNWLFLSFSLIEDPEIHSGYLITFGRRWWTFSASIPTTGKEERTFLRIREQLHWHHLSRIKVFKRRLKGFCRKRLSKHNKRRSRRKRNKKEVHQNSNHKCLNPKAKKVVQWISEGLKFASNKTIRESQEWRLMSWNRSRNCSTKGMSWFQCIQGVCQKRRRNSWRS